MSQTEILDDANDNDDDHYANNHDYNTDHHNGPFALECLKPRF